MEGITYQSEVPSDLSAIKGKAQSAGYQTDYKYIGGLVFLVITGYVTALFKTVAIE